MNRAGRLCGRRDERVAQTELGYAALSDDSVHADFGEGKLADHIDKLVLLGDAEDIGLEDEAFGRLKTTLE
jgi:hypothetical protein